MRVLCEVELCDIENENGNPVAGVVATCSRCEYSVESYGQSERSVRRCLALLREECPQGEENFYVDENE